MDVRPLGEELEADPHAFGRYCFVLERPVLLAEPIKLKGKLGLFEPTAETVEALAAAEPAAAADASIVRAECERVGRALELPEDERLIELCWNYVGTKDFAAAERIATMLIDTQTRLGEAFGVRSSARLNLDRVAEALAAAEAAIAAAPTKGMSYLARSDVYARMAELDSEKAYELSPELGAGHGEGDEEGG